MQNKPKVKIGNIGKTKLALSEPVLSKVEGVEWVKIDKINLSSFMTSKYGKNGHLAK
jgi:hypothetical protein